MKLLVEKHRNKVKIMPEVIIAAAENFDNGEGIMRLLLEKRGNEVEITSEVVAAAERKRRKGRGRL